MSDTIHLLRLRAAMMFAGTADPDYALVSGAADELEEMEGRIARAIFLLDRHTGTNPTAIQALDMLTEPQRARKQESVDSERES